jgi:hypothetical protein
MLAMVLPSDAGNGATGVTWPQCDVEVESCSRGAVESCWRRRWRGDLAAARCRCRVMLATMLPSHAGDGATEATWPRRDINAESCWLRRYRGNLAASRCRGRVMLATMLLSLASDGAATQGCIGCGKVAQPPSSEHRGVVAS